MVNLSPPLPMILDLNRGSGREVFCLALLASISDLFPGFFSRNWVPSFALVLVRGLLELKYEIKHIQSNVSDALFSPLISSRRD